MSFVVKNKIIFFVIISFMCVLLLSIGYAQIAYDLKITGDISLQSQNDVVITKVLKVSEFGNTKSKVLHYVGTILTMSVDLDSSIQSSVLYKVEVENTMDYDYIFQDVVFDKNNEFQTYTNPDIIPTVLSESDLEKYYIDNQNSIFIGDIIKAHSTRCFYVIYHYQNSSNNSSLESGMVHFKFDRIHSILCDSNVCPSYVIDEGTLHISYSNSIPSSIKVYDFDGNSIDGYTYESGSFYMDSVRSSLKIVEVYE